MLWKKQNSMETLRFHQAVEISWTSWDFMRKLRLHEKFRFYEHGEILMKTFRFHGKVETSWKIEISWKSLDFMKNWDFMKQSRFHAKVNISWKSRSMLAVDVCFQVFRATVRAREGEALRVTRAVNNGWRFTARSKCFLSNFPPSLPS